MTNTPLKNSLVTTEYFWSVLKGLNAVTTSCDIEEFLERTGASFSEFHEVCEFMKNIDFPFALENVGDKTHLVPTRDWLTVNMDFSLIDWLAMQATFSEAQFNGNNPAFSTLNEKLNSIAEYYPDFDIVSALESYWQKAKSMNEVPSEYESFFSTLQDAISTGVGLDIKTHSGRTMVVYPHQVVYLEGVLSIVAEDCDDRCLVFLGLNEIERVGAYDEEYSPNFSSIEVKDFISAMRVVTGDEVRLVLKVQAEKHIELNPKFHFLGNPYITQNFDGDIIWAASVEVSNELFEWLYEIREGVEILDPGHLKSDFAAYCATRYSDDMTEFKKVA
ncbi:WYL domain protein [Bacteriovorax sp. BSW11_IV]|uniref:WYL domain-containing protein n=1 Tax=Bacteriovorax sp. BSW11_IV TaxID=1353529 RepID=UPI00038A02F3|nr:WYL domain-containing protein [Bacteriovorax sp. BSW11_IV]EQC49952.1 WYL domain protein [Bacteriovorax sp. BSW11_IV]